ncbi:MAG: leucine-rich repeat domain-containing protein, partial [Candidatus Thorarchaeota archaeon]
MGLDPVRIRENIEHLGKTEAQTMLREWIVSSEDNFKRREALEVYISLDDGKNFRFYEQLFLTDEDEEIRNLAGLSLKQNYISDKRLLILLKFILEEQKQLEIKPNLFAIELLNSINKKRARKILREYLEKFFGIIVEKKIENKKLQVLKESIISNLDHNSPLSRELLEILINLRLAVYYEQGCGYNVKMIENFIVQLNCEGANISDISEIYDLDKLNRLIYLNLHRNKIKRVDNLSNLKDLISLNLSENKLQNIECESYDGLNNLIELDLASNQIKKIEPFTLENLTKLSLDRNLISEITNLNDLKNLEYLNLSHNHIERIQGLHT